MGKVFEGIDERLERWIAAQPVLDPDGHVNVSPKGPIESLRVLGPLRLAYLDFVGSGAETVAHLRENGRIVIMLCAFSGPPRILRLHGRGSMVAAGEPGFDELLSSCGFDAVDGVPEARRSIVTVSVERIADSCGYGVPLMSYQGRREHMDLWAAKKLRVGGPDALLDYQREKNSVSIDGLPAVDLPVPVVE
jgi:hypothetical protein